MEQKKYDVFISHSSKDHELAELICNYLERDGDIACWIAPRDVVGGIPYAQSIMDGIEAAQVIILVSSEHVNESPHVVSEIDRAFNLRKVIIPFRIDVSELSVVLNYYLCASHYIDGTPQPENAFDRLRDSVRRNLPRLSRDMAASDAIQMLAERYHVPADKIRKLFENQRKSDAGQGGGEKSKYTIYQNKKGEIMLMITPKEGEPDCPWLFYDGGDSALLYRNSDSAVLIPNIAEEARQPLREIPEVLVVETDTDLEEVVREYVVEVRIVSDVSGLYSLK